LPSPAGVYSSNASEAYAAGVRDFGESRVQEAASKQGQLQDLPDITWHFIEVCKQQKP